MNGLTGTPIWLLELPPERCCMSAGTETPTGGGSWTWLETVTTQTNLHSGGQRCVPLPCFTYCGGGGDVRPLHNVHAETTTF